MNAQTQNVGAASRPADVLATLRQASVKTGTDFAYLLNTAMRESSLQPQAKSKHSSATGLFQFIDQTWLGLVKRYGTEHGLGAFAAAIEQNKGGVCTVASAETKAAILALRKDPELSALMAGEAARETKQSLECSLGREVNCGELYAAHFLGQGGAKKLLSLHESDPAQRADLAFGQAAKANRSVFYHADGRAKSVGEVYDWIVKTPGGAQMAAAPAAAQPRQTAMIARTASEIARHEAVTTFAPERVALSRTMEIQPAFPERAARAAFKPFAMTSFFALPPLPQPALMLTSAIVEILASVGADSSATHRRSKV